MERTELEHLQAQLDRMIRKHFPDDGVRRVSVLQYGDDPGVEPGELLVRVFIVASGGPEERRQALEDFERRHSSALTEVRRDLNMIREIGPIEIVAGGEGGEGGDGGDGGEGGEGGEGGSKGLQPRMRMGPRALNLKGDGLGAAPLVPVMARLGPADLETVDTLITAGIAANRAEAVRWALARIRERPAYIRLRERAREIEELKAQF